MALLDWPLPFRSWAASHKACFLGVGFGFLTGGVTSVGMTGGTGVAPVDGAGISHCRERNSSVKASLTLRQGNRISAE
jgi:hypothetical protein